MEVWADMQTYTTTPGQQCLCSLQPADVSLPATKHVFSLACLLRKRKCAERKGRQRWTLQKTPQHLLQPHQVPSLGCLPGLHELPEAWEVIKFVTSCSRDSLTSLRAFSSQFCHSTRAVLGEGLLVQSFVLN